jgi:hypothetical protein
MTTALEAELDALTYTVESKRWNFEKYVGKHVELYNTACDLEQHGYHGPDVPLEFVSLYLESKLTS